MDPLTIIALAKGFLSATGLGEKAKNWMGDKVGIKTASRIVEISSAIIGDKSPGDMTEDERLKIRAEIENAEADLREMAYQDLADARAMYTNSDHKMADRIALNIMRYNMIGVGALVAANVGIIVYVENPTIAVAIGNIIGASISYLWQERQAVTGFFFGSSQGSKNKDKRK